MPEKDYISKTYTALQENLEGFDKNEESFREAMKDQGYAKKVYTALKDNLEGFDRSENDFYENIGLKKKPSSDQSSGSYKPSVPLTPNGTKGTEGFGAETPVEAMAGTVPAKPTIKTEVQVNKPDATQTDIIDQTKVDYSKPKPEEYAKSIDDIITNAIARGSAQGEEANLLTVTADQSPDDIKRLANIERRKEYYPTSAEYANFSKAKTFTEAMDAFVRNPGKILTELSLESLSALARHGSARLAAATGTGAAAGSVVPGIGTASGAATGAVVGLGLSSLNLEYSGDIMESLKEHKVDTSDPESLKKAFGNESLISEIRATALKKGIPVALFDMLSAGLAGRILSKPAKTIVGKILKVGTETGIQAGLGGAGELAGEVSAGEKINPSAIVGEMIGEVGGGIGKIATGTMFHKAKDGTLSTGDIVDAVMENKENPAVVMEQIDISQHSGEISPELAGGLKKIVAHIAEVDATVPPEIEDPKARGKSVELIITRNNIDADIREKQAELEKVDEAFRPVKEKEIADLTKERKNVNKEILAISEKAKNEKKSKPAKIEPVSEEKAGEEVVHDKEATSDAGDKNGEVQEAGTVQETDGNLNNKDISSNGNTTEDEAKTKETGKAEKAVLGDNGASAEDNPTSAVKRLPDEGAKTKTKKREAQEKFFSENIPDHKSRETSEIGISDKVIASVKNIELPDGDEGYNVTVKDSEGKEIDSQDFYEKPEVVKFLSTKQRGYELSQTEKKAEATKGKTTVDISEGSDVYFRDNGGALGKGTVEGIEDGEVKIKTPSGTIYKRNLSEVNEETAARPFDSLRKAAKVLRQGKIEDDIAMAGVPFAKEIWNGAIEIGAKTLEGGADVAEAIKLAIQHIKSSEWYQGLKKGDQEKALEKFGMKVHETLKTPEQREADLRHDVESGDEGQTRKKKFIQTVRGSAETTEELKEKTDELDAFYDAVKNKESLNEANKEINNDVGKAREFVMGDSAPSAKKSAMAVQLIKHFERNKDFDSAIEVLDSYDKQLREAGRFIQAASLWNKISPETLVRVAKKAIPNITPEIEKAIYEKMAEVSKMEEGVEKDKATLEVLNYIADQIPHTKSELFDAFRYQNMLSNPKSHERNIYGNLFNMFVTRPLELVSESGYDVLTNMDNPAARTTKLAQIPEYYKDVMRTVPEAFMAAKEVYKGGALSDKVLDLGNASNMIEALRKEKLPKYLTVASRFLEAQDRFFSVLIAQGEKLRLMKSGVTEVKANEQAIKLASEYLYRDKLNASDKSKPTLVRALDALGQGVNQLRRLPVVGKPLSWFVPFVTTPINVAKAQVRFSPLGFIGGDYSKGQVSSAALGTIVMGVGATLALQGITTWRVPKDKAEREMFYASGRKPYSIKIGDAWVPMQYFGPFALSLALPAAVKYYQNENKTALTDNQIEKLVEAIYTTSGFMTSQTPVAGIDGFSKAISGDEDTDIGKEMGRMATQAIPFSGLLRYTNNILDPVYRKTHGFIESIESGIPGMSNGLDAYEIKRGSRRGQVSEREPVNMFLPYDIGFNDEEYEALLKNRQNQMHKKDLRKNKQ